MMVFERSDSEDGSLILNIQISSKELKKIRLTKEDRQQIKEYKESELGSEKLLELYVILRRMENPV